MGGDKEDKAQTSETGLSFCVTAVVTAVPIHNSANM